MQAQRYPELANPLPDHPRHYVGVELGGWALAAAGAITEMASQEGYGKVIAAAGLAVVGLTGCFSRMRGNNESEPSS